MGFLRYDSDFMLFLGRVADLAWLNILCFICSLPIITSGAAISAKYYTAMKLERGEAPGVTRAFFHSFKQNFLQNTWISIIVVLIVAFFGMDWYLIYKSGAGSMNAIVFGMLILFTAMFSIIIFCIFPMLARFQMKTFDAFRNALIFGVVHLPRVVLGIFMAIIPYFIGIWYFKWAWLIWLFIECVALYYNSIFFIKKFEILEKKTFGEVKNPYKPDREIKEEELTPLFQNENAEADSEEEISEVEVSKDETSEDVISEGEVSEDETPEDINDNEDDKVSEDKL